MARMENAIKFFRDEGIAVSEPGSPEYEKAIATSNFMFRFSRPDCVVHPKTTSEVQTIIIRARDSKLKVTVKGNGHSYAGHSTASSGISLDLRSMRNVELDMESKTVTADAGCQWGHVYGTLVNGKHDGYIINGDRCPTVGVSGFILGAGLGPFTRSFGMGCDALTEATVVTAEGSVVTVSEADDPTTNKGRLFWALCGAGGGNFGVLVQVKLKVQELRNRHGLVVAGRYNWYPANGFTDDVVSTMVNFYMAEWPDKITIDTTWVCDLQKNQIGVRFNVSFDGSKPEHDRLIDRHIKRPELACALKRRVLAETSTRYLFETLAAQWLEETERAYPTNKTYALFSSFAFANGNEGVLQEAAAALQQLAGEFQADFRNEKANFLATWIHSGGEATRKKATDTAFFWRQAVFHMYLTVEWVEKRIEYDMRLFLAKAKRLLRPLSLNGEAAFVNFPDRDLPTKSHERAYFGNNKDELRRVKEIWDRTKFFNWSQGVRLPGDPDEDADEGDKADEDGKADGIAGRRWDSYKANTCDIVGDLEELADLGF
ncbi:hypothetical protein RB595_010293 [Gaeumannomyces hyphopodioides]